MPRSKKGLGRCHKSGTGNNQSRRRTTPCDNRGFNSNDCNSKSIEMSLLVISVSLPLNNSVINTPQLSLVCQHSKSNELSSPVIPKIPPWNDPFINPTQLSSVRQQSSSSSPNTTHELQASSIPGRTSPDPSIKWSTIKWWYGGLIKWFNVGNRRWRNKRWWRVVCVTQLVIMIQ